MSNRLTNAQRESAISKMLTHTFEKQFNQLTEKYINLLKDYLEATLIPGHKICKESGIDTAYFDTRQSFAFIDSNGPVAMHLPSNQAFKLPTGLHASAHTPEGARQVKVTTSERIITPCHNYGVVDLTVEPKTKELTELEKKHKKLRTESKKLADEINEYQGNITKVLYACTTMKKLNDTFPAAVEFFPTQKQAEASALPVPVELINNLTKKLNQAA